MKPSKRAVRTDAERVAREIARDEKRRRRVRDAFTGRIVSPEALHRERAERHT